MLKPLVTGAALAKNKKIKKRGHVTDLRLPLCSTRENYTANIKSDSRGSSVVVCTDFRYLESISAGRRHADM